MNLTLEKQIYCSSFNIAELYNVKCINKIGTTGLLSFCKVKYLYLPPNGIFRSTFELLQLKKDFDKVENAEDYIKMSFTSFRKYIGSIYSVKNSAVYMDDFSSIEPIKIDLTSPKFQNQQEWLEVRYNNTKIGSIRNNNKGFIELDGKLNKKRFVESYSFVNYNWAIENQLMEIRESNSIIESYENLVKNFELFAEKIVTL